MSRQMYIDGNTVLQPVEEPRKARPARKPRTTLHSRYVRRINALNFLYTLTVIGVVAVIFGFCVSYLNTRASLQANEAKIASLQAELSTLTSENDDKAMKLSADVDYDEIYRQATEELGMVYPSEGQVVEYSAGDSEYVEQYSDVPSGE
ncbi:MAG: septum formation initiator family protein [Lachnospiraceae bacterium]